MTLTKRVRITALALVCATIAGAAAAAPQAISPRDALRYVAAFEAVERGDFIDAQVQSSEIEDQALAGYVAFSQLMHPTAHKAGYDELAGWLKTYGDQAPAERVYALAAKRRPPQAPALNIPLLSGIDWSQIEQVARKVVGLSPSDRGRAAREAFYSGDPKRALSLAAGAGERWIAGMSAYRLKDYAQAQTYLDQVARDEAEDPWLRSGGAFWAARAAQQTGDTDRAAGYLRAAARYPETFYGMIAERQVRLNLASLSAVPTVDFLLTAYTGPDAELSQFVSIDPRAHRAAALAQVGKIDEAGVELRMGLGLAKTAADQRRWSSLIQALGTPLTSDVDVSARAVGIHLRAQADYPVPDLAPKSGFTIDKALVYAIVRQESRFNPQVVSPAGAVGLMQLMPAAAARAAGDDKLATDMTPLFDPAFNLEVGQNYVSWLMERGVGYDLLRTVAAYNAGPGALQKTAKLLGDEADSLMLIECLPSVETRNYVEKVVTAYWTYRGKFGQETKTLDALAGGAKYVDARLDR